VREPPPVRSTCAGSGNLRRPGKPPQLSSAVNRSKLNNRDRRPRPSRSLARLRIPRRNRSILRTMSIISHDQTANQFTTEIDGHRAELDYTVADGVMTITHTRVPQAIGGRGIAAELMREAVQVAGNADGPSIRLVPTRLRICASTRKHPTNAISMNYWMRRWTNRSPPATRPRWAEAASREFWAAG